METSVILTTSLPIDSASLLERCMGDPGFVCMLLRKFGAQLESLMTQVDAAATSGEFPSICKVAHSLKGSAGNLSAVEVAAGAKRLEDAAHDLDIESVRTIVAQLHEQVRRCSAFVPELIARLSGESSVGVG